MQFDCGDTTVSLRTSREEQLLVVSCVEMVSMCGHSVV